VVGDELEGHRPGERRLAHDAGQHALAGGGEQKLERVRPRAALADHLPTAAAVRKER
jgi:hypothetical protein